MEWQNNPSAYLASLLASTSPAQPRLEHANSPYTQPAISVDYPLSNVREQPPFSAAHGSMNFAIPHAHNPNLMQLHRSTALGPQPNPYITPFAPQYQAYPYLAAAPGHYQTYQLLTQERVAASATGQEGLGMDDVIPRVRTASPETDPEEPEEKEKPGRNLRRFRKKRKHTPILVFDDDSDDVDYKEAPSKKTKRTKYDYDSEGAIEADAVCSSSEEPSEPTMDPRVERLKSKPNTGRTSARTSRRTPKDSPAPKEKGSDAKARSEKASALLNRKGKGRPIPKSVQECDEADLMMWQWKHGGRSWKDIRKEWIRIMGVVPGRSSLSVRLAKMEDNFIDNGAANDLMILKYKEEVEAELEDLKWKKVAAKIKKEMNLDMKPLVVRKRYVQLQDNGFVVGMGTGVGDRDGEGEGEEDDRHGSETVDLAEDSKQPSHEGSTAELENERTG